MDNLERMEGLWKKMEGLRKKLCSIRMLFGIIVFVSMIVSVNETLQTNLWFISVSEILLIILSGIFLLINVAIFVMDWILQALILIVPDFCLCVIWTFLFIGFLSIVI